MKLLLLFTVFSCLESKMLQYVGIREDGQNRGQLLESFLHGSGYKSSEAYCGYALFTIHNQCNADYPKNYPWAPSWAPEDRIVWRNGEDPEVIEPGMTVNLFWSGRVRHVGSVLYLSKDGNGWYVVYWSGNTRSNNIIAGEGTHLVKMYLRSIAYISDWRNPREKFQYHVLQSGENLYRLSLKYNKSVAEIRKLNGLKENEIVYIGQKIRVG